MACEWRGSTIGADAGDDCNLGGIRRRAETGIRIKRGKHEVDRLGDGEFCLPTEASTDGEFR